MFWVYWKGQFLIFREVFKITEENNSLFFFFVINRLKTCKLQIICIILLAYSIDAVKYLKYKDKFYDINMNLSFLSNNKK